MRSLLVATTNKGKRDEIRQVLSGHFDQLLCLADFPDPPDVVEDRPSYYENAFKKARQIGDYYGIGTLADDSGLEVAALQGRPGVYSSRYGTNDRERIDRLLGELAGVPMEKRGAAFKAYLAYYRPDSERACLFYGSIAGTIGFDRLGDQGFGFDPVFMLPHLGKSFAELTKEEKNRISHRGKALASFERFLTNQLR
jgi:XTP/dITP diphosphohydrolase